MIERESNTPLLPPELEREIFLSAVASSKVTASQLLLIAKRVYHWMLPIMYKVVICYQGKCPPLESLRRHGEHVRHLLLAPYDTVKHIQTAQLPDVLTFCPNVRNLALWTGDYDLEQLNALHRLQLTHLSADIIQLSRYHNPENGAAAGDNPTSKDIPRSMDLKITGTRFFSSLTHVDTTASVENWKECHILSQLPNLTHVSFDSASNPKILEPLLTNCPKLLVVILVQGNDDWDYHAEEVGEDEASNLPVHDVRVVELSCGFVVDWKAGANGEMDIWRVGEEVVKRRMRN
ncbi:hypothetical protein BDN72DRAFT_966380 [Pluteus cervinus]|uniref:Uncharacterized protein n=1 Tax=Pluteus cervinus TaxID=181527 RepID=A0ACD2ZY85_9AGAR|nr:hypothetical protein BDN72DRAFT_966380 [Pluteus cervinus]